MVWEGMKRRMALDSLFGRRRRLSCFFWFLLLFGVGVLLFFIQLQDAPGCAPQQGYALQLEGTLQQSRETLSTQDKERGKSDIYQDHQAKSDLYQDHQAKSDIYQDHQAKSDIYQDHQAKSDIYQDHQAKSDIYQDHQHQAADVFKVLKTSPPTRCINNNTPTSSSSSPSSWSCSGLSSHQRWRDLCSIQEQRQQLVRTMCAKYRSRISKTITLQLAKNIYVEDKYKILYCQVPKVGCSNWKRSLMVLGGQASDPQDIPHEMAHSRRLKTLDSFQRSGAIKRLKTYTKVMFVREPLERMVSAYRDKFENPNEYYHSSFGKYIISKYRVNASRAALDSGDGVTFQEFVQYLLDVHRPVGMDIHWETANQLCSPCLIDYDFIGKFENMDDESSLFLHLVGAPPNFTLPTFKDRNPGDKKTSSEITQKYFAQVGPSERQRVYDFYYKDYLMFNYSKPFPDLH
uniref:carbohydrate sulfotransferase 8-like n=1 Tax=Doryrhamphus excisus TaxID=161450 RepID=UPI0025AEC65A|nr:carbohydrate sulfotransferase 8-like [Doryrhamphus excisus]XP_057944643.1 carbohydrate sulfotransferase 8-like [Doryrhamphus excisus]